MRPWCEVKSRRGAPKRVNTEGFACPNRKCFYFGNTDAQMHALVGDGKHGCAEQIQTFRGPACRTTFSARRDTPLYLYWLLRASVQNQARRGGEKSSFPACKHRKVGVQFEVVDSMLMLERRYSYMMEKLLLWLVL